MKIPPGHADEQTDRTKLIVAFTSIPARLKMDSTNNIM